MSLWNRDFCDSWTNKAFGDKFPTPKRGVCRRYLVIAENERNFLIKYSAKWLEFSNPSNNYWECLKNGEGNNFKYYLVIKVILIENVIFHKFNLISLWAALNLPSRVYTPNPNPNQRKVNLQFTETPNLLKITSKPQTKK